MSPTTLGWLVFACLLAGVCLGMAVRGALPEHHLSQDSKDVVKLGIGLIGTMAALVIGLLIASAKQSFDAVDSELKQLATKMILADRVLASYGPETAEVRDLIRRSIAQRVDQVWPEGSSHTMDLKTLDTGPSPIEVAEGKIRGLTPQNDVQRSLQSHALDIFAGMGETRWLLFGQMGQRSIPVPFLVVLVVWLTVIFASFGLFAPRNATVIAVLIFCALSASAAIFLIVEMDRPFAGLMKVSGAPLRYALSRLGQ